MQAQFLWPEELGSIDGGGRRALGGLQSEEGKDMH